MGLKVSISEKLVSFIYNPRGKKVRNEPAREKLTLQGLKGSEEGLYNLGSVAGDSELGMLDEKLHDERMI